MHPGLSLPQAILACVILFGVPTALLVTALTLRFIRADDARKDPADNLADADEPYLAAQVRAVLHPENERP